MKVVSFAVAGVCLFAALVGAGCRSEIIPPSTSADAGSSGDPGSVLDGQAPANGPWAKGPCGVCTLGQCTQERTLCDAEPSCLAHARCVEECPSAPDGRISEACVEACPRTEGTPASRARAAFDTCVLKTGNDRCPACERTKKVPITILGQSCGASTDPTVCGKCEDEKCCQTLQACIEEPACKQQLQPCMKACNGDAACWNRCFDTHPKGVGPWGRREGCIRASCLAECAESNDACLVCAQVDECREPYAACSSNEDCFRGINCMHERCPDVTDACLESCFTPAGRRLFDEWASCTVLSCADRCQ